MTVRDRLGAIDNPSPVLFPIRSMPGGPVVVRIASLEEALPGVLAVFSTRLGGVSRGPWLSLNVGYHVGDSPVDVTENRRRLFRALDLDPAALVTAGQVHGDTVALAAAPGRHERTDGLATRARGLVLSVFTADCVPIWLLDPRTPAAALIHAGWRGSLAGIAGRAVGLLASRLGVRPGNLVAAIGPSIGPCCYEVDPDVSAPAVRLWGPSVLTPPVPGGKVRLDLWEVNRLVLTQAGLDPWRIHVSGLCTFCREDLFFSHRREVVRSARSGEASPSDGRMVALLRLGAGGQSQTREESLGSRRT
jgi:YfiH family protein